MLTDPYRVPVSVRRTSLLWAEPSLVIIINTDATSTHSTDYRRIPSLVQTNCTLAGLLRLVGADFVLATVTGMRMTDRLFGRGTTS